MSALRGRKRKQELKPRAEPKPPAFEPVALMDVKLEPLDIGVAAVSVVEGLVGNYGGNVAQEFCEHKPDVDELQREILRQQQQLIQNTGAQQQQPQPQQRKSPASNNNNNNSKNKNNSGNAIKMQKPTLATKTLRARVQLQPQQQQQLGVIKEAAAAAAAAQNVIKATPQSRVPMTTTRRRVTTSSSSITTTTTAAQNIINPTQQNRVPMTTMGKSTTAPPPPLPPPSSLASLSIAITTTTAPQNIMHPTQHNRVPMLATGRSTTTPPTPSSASSSLSITTTATGQNRVPMSMTGKSATTSSPSSLISPSTMAAAAAAAAALLTTQPAAAVKSYATSAQAKPNAVKVKQATTRASTVEERAFDVQESDSEEDGYSEIDFGEDELIEVDEDEQDLYDPQWFAQATSPRMVFKFKHDCAEVGMHGRPKHSSAVFYFVRLLMNRYEFFTQLANGCNKWALNSLRGAKFSQFTGDEMEIFMGLCLQMCNMKLPQIADYWQPKANYGFSGFGQKMSEARFREVLKFLSFEYLIGVNSPSASAPLGDIGRLVNFFNQRMNALYTCGPSMVLNDPITYWKGKFHWHSEMREKRRANALQLHFLIEQRGLVLKLALEHPSNAELSVVGTKNSRVLVEQRIELAQKLLNDYLNQGRTLYVSKYYGSYGLGCELAHQSTYCTGFLDRNRYGNSRELVLTALAPNSFETKYATPVMMGKWRQKHKCFYFYSSDCLAIYAREMSMQKMDARPKIIKEINWHINSTKCNKEHMIDYQLGLQPNELEWDRQIAIYIFNLFVLNAYTLYTFYTANYSGPRGREGQQPAPKPYAEFRQDIIQSLLNDKDVIKETEAPAAASVANRKRKRTSELSGEPVGGATATAAPSSSKGAKAAAGEGVAAEAAHTPMLISHQGKLLKKRCRICFAKTGLSTLTKYVCKRCPGMPGLCDRPCFKMWHDQLKKMTTPTPES